MPNHHALAVIADACNPTLAIAALAVIGHLLWREPCSAHTRKAICSLVAVLIVVYAWMGMDRWVRASGWIGVHYSTHTAFALALAAFVVGYVPRTLVPLCVALVAYLALIVYLGYHSVADVGLTLLLVGPAVVWIVRKTSARQRAIALPVDDAR